MELLKALNIKDLNPGAISGYEWKAPISQLVFSSTNPADETCIANVSECLKKDYETLISKASHAQKIWQTWPAPKRGEVIRDIGEAIFKHQETLSQLIAMEMGKPLIEARGEVQEMIDMARFSTGLSRMLYGKTMHSERPFHRMYEQWHPYGLIGVISAFNFPVAVWSWNAFIGAICGNVIIWKPSQSVPLTAIAVMNICNVVLEKHGAPAVFSLMLTSDHAISQSLVEDIRLPLISFTGSTKVGCLVSELVAKRLGKSILELGGNNAVIVDASANLPLAISSIVFGAIGTSGQRCTSTRRVFVHESCFKKVSSELKSIFSQIIPSNPLDERCVMGPLVNKEAVLNFSEAITTLKNKGAKILAGGSVKSGAGFFVEPTLVTEVQNDWPIVQKETFAPILYLMPFKTLEEAMMMHNAVPQGLSSALFTTKLEDAEFFLSENGSDCGIANINIGTSGAEIGGAFGGEKQTGGGREAGSDAWKGYMRRQTNTINWGRSLPLAQGIVFSLDSFKK